MSSFRSTKPGQGLVSPRRCSMLLDTCLLDAQDVGAVLRASCRNRHIFARWSTLPKVRARNPYG